ncbi:MAG: glycosyltransferase [Chloroflexi bacterium]|nr:glycosyltransferase [Chloroflexota bacterium]
MRIGILLPGFSSDEHDLAIPVQHHLVRALAQQHDVRVLALRYPHRRASYTIGAARVMALGAAQGRGASRLLLWAEALYRLAGMHRAQPFDVLHAMWADECGLLAGWAGRLLGVPAVVSVAGGELVGFDDIAYGLQRGALGRWTVRRALKGAHVVIAACTYTRRLLAPFALPDVRILPLGVDTAHFCPDETPRLPGHLLHVASLVGVKDQATLLRALARLPQEVTLDIVGTGPEEGRLRALADTLGVSRRVQFVGAVAHHNLPPYYRRAALHVLSSRHEGLGMVTLEAAACGLASVSTAVGLLPDWPELGVWVPVGDDAALAAAIAGLLADDTRRAALGESALRLARARFGVETTASALTALYAALQKV